MFSKETYLQRRAQLASSVSTGVILLPGNEEAPMNYADNTYHFRQDSTFLYYFGISQASLFGVIDADAGKVRIPVDQAMKLLVEDYDNLVTIAPPAPVVEAVTEEVAKEAAVEAE